MNQNPAITDDPLPDGQLVDDAVKAASSGVSDSPVAREELQDFSAVDQSSSHLAPPQLNPNHSSYGLHDPTTLAAVDTLELHDPELHPVETSELAAPIWTPPSEAAVETADGKQSASPILSQQPSVLSHLAQVGLTSSDQWEEQIQPRIQKLQDDIAQVHVQLDELERTKPKKIS